MVGEDSLKFNKDLETLQSLQRLEDATDDAYARDDYHLMYKLIRSRMNRLIPLMSSSEENDQVARAHSILLRCRTFNPQKKVYAYDEESLLELNLFLHQISVLVGIQFNKLDSLDGVAQV